MNFLEELVAEKHAFPPQWISAIEPTTGLPYSRLRQRYFIGLYYGSPDPNPPDLTVYFTDTLPADLTFESERHAPSMHVQQQGQTLTWQTHEPLPADHTVQVLLSAVAENPEPGQTLTNTAEVGDDGSNGADPTPENNSAATWTRSMPVLICSSPRTTARRASRRGMG